MDRQTEKRVSQRRVHIEGRPARQQREEGSNQQETVCMQATKPNARRLVKISRAREKNGGGKAAACAVAAAA